MYLADPVTPTDLYVESFSIENKYRGLLNANFQDYMDAIRQSGQLEIQSAKLKQRVSGVIASLGMAARAFGGPAGLSLGFAIGNTVGKYFGNVLSGRVYGQAINDMAEVVGYAKMRHTQLASSIMFQKKMGEAVDTLRQNDNKRLKDAIQEMQV